MNRDRLKHSEILRKLCRLKLETERVKQQLRSMKSNISTFQMLVPTQFHKYLVKNKENMQFQTKVHFSETTIGNALVQKTNLKNLSNTQGMHQKIMKELNDLKGLEKKEHIVRYINDSRSKYGQNKKSSLPEDNQKKSTSRIRESSLRVFQNEESPVNDLAMSTVSILTSSKNISEFKSKPIGLKCPKKHEFYCGNLVNGIPHGHGRLTVCCSQMPLLVSPSVLTYNGNFNNGKFHGLGTLTCKDGCKYVGSFREGKKEGEGSLYQDGKMEICIFKEDRLLEML